MSELRSPSICERTNLQRIAPELGQVAVGEAAKERKHVGLRARGACRGALNHGNERKPDWAYSNTYYVLAGLVIEAATDRIVGPLCLTDIYAPGDDPHLPRPHAHTYTRFPDSLELHRCICRPAANVLAVCWRRTDADGSPRQTPSPAVG